MRFDVIGSRDRAVAIAEIPAGMRRQKKRIAAAIMKQHKNVKSVLMKASQRRGVYRLRRLQLIAGSRNTEVMHTESGCRFLVDPRKAYFSVREGTERLRLAQLVQRGENVGVFFAGVGPFAIVIAKRGGARVVGIEKNPAAVRYFQKNIGLNKLDNVTAVKLDAKNAPEKFSGAFDRILMPLPESALDYLSSAAACLKKGGVIHVYFFSREDEIPAVKKEVKKTLKKARFTGLQRVLPYAPRVFKWRLDVRLH